MVVTVVMAAGSEMMGVCLVVVVMGSAVMAPVLLLAGWASVWRGGVMVVNVEGTWVVLVVVAAVVVVGGR